MKSTVIAVILALLLFAPALHSVNAQIAIDSFASIPDKVMPGEELTLELNLENVGDDDIENVVVTVDLTAVPFAPVGSSTEKVIDEINDHDQDTIYFTLKALPSAELQIYKIPVIITYDGFSKTSLVGVEVQAKATLDLFLENSDAIVVDQQGKITLKFVNNGLAQIKLLKVTLQESASYDIVSPSSLYIGEVDIGDFETEEFTIIPTTTNPSLILDLEYSNSANRRFTDTKLLPLKVYTKEEAQQLGLIDDNGSFFPILAIVVVVVAAAFIYRKAKKRKHAP